MATNPATSADLVARSLRTLSSQEIAVGGTLLGDAWNVIKTQVPSVPARVDSDAPFSSLVVQVECAMVLRVLNNPNGKLEESVDDYSYRLDAAVSTGALYLTGPERELLSWADGGSDNAFTIRAAATPFSESFPVWDSLL